MQLNSYNDIKSDQIKQKEIVIKKLKSENDILKNQLEQMRFKLENNNAVAEPEAKENIKNIVIFINSINQKQTINTIKDEKVYRTNRSEINGETINV